MNTLVNLLQPLNEDSPIETTELSAMITDTKDVHPLNATVPIVSIPRLKTTSSIVLLMLSEVTVLTGSPLCTDGIIIRVFVSVPMPVTE